MLYPEFIEGTGCRDNKHNYRVYKDLEIMYMNSDMTKAEIYEYGKKLVDNSKSEKQLKAEAEIKAQIKSLKDDIQWWKEEQEKYEYWLATEVIDRDKALWKRNIQNCKEQIKAIRGNIKDLQWILG